jgi:hypothetical protein
MKHSFARAVLLGCLALLPAFSWAQGFVARAQFSTDVVDREPIDDIGSTIKVEYGEIQRVYFFSDLREMQGTQVMHRWLLDGEVQAEIPFDIGGNRWRVWSSKRLMPGFDGRWAVEVVQDGDIIETYAFDYVDE